MPAQVMCSVLPTTQTLAQILLEHGDILVLQPQPQPQTVRLSAARPVHVVSGRY